jgi:hypothetical protein
MKPMNFYSKFLMLAIFLASLSCLATEALREPDLSGPGYLPKDGFVPDKATALSIAVAVLIPIYGGKTISGEQPLVPTLKDGVWTVSGSLPPDRVGGVAEIKIDKASGKILKVGHGK